MKTLLALSTLSIKLLMLLCVSGMGIWGALDITAETKAPCHQQMEEEKSMTDVPCGMCETALESWDMDGVLSLNMVDGSQREVLFADTAFKPPEIVPTILLDNYQPYYPPPDVIAKSLAPLTKTIVLLV